MSTTDRVTSDQGRGATARGRLWVGHLDRIEAEGIAVKDYAAREGLPVQTLYQAKKRLVARGAWPRLRTTVAPTFARVRLVESPPVAPGPWALRLRLPSGAVLEWSALPGADLLGALLAQVSSARRSGPARRWRSTRQRSRERERTRKL